MKTKASLLVLLATAFCLAQTATEYESPAVNHIAGMLNCNCGCHLRMDCVMPPTGICPVCKAAKIRIAKGDCPRPQTAAWSSACDAVRSTVVRRDG